VKTKKSKELHDKVFESVKSSKTVPSTWVNPVGFKPKVEHVVCYKEDLEIIRAIKTYLLQNDIAISTSNAIRIGLRNYTISPETFSHAAEVISLDRRKK
jgi:hypothetical protein